MKSTTYLEELAYKLYYTKGARFEAHDRLKRTARLSMISSSLLNAYLIVAGLLSVYNIYSEQLISTNLTAYLITSLSILLMVFNQVEAVKQYDKRGQNFLDCALALSSLYEELRIFQSLQAQPSEQEVTDFARQIKRDYEQILKDAENHLPIDYDLYRTKKRTQHQLTHWQVANIRLKHYLSAYVFYHLLIGSPLVLGMFIYYLK